MIVISDWSRRVNWICPVCQNFQSIMISVEKKSKSFLFCFLLNYFWIVKICFRFLKLIWFFVFNLRPLLNHMVWNCTWKSHPKVELTIYHHPLVSFVDFEIELEIYIASVFKNILWFELKWQWNRFNNWNLSYRVTWFEIWIKNVKKWKFVHPDWFRSSI